MDKIKKINFIPDLVLILLFLIFIGSGMVIGPFFGDINVIDEGQFAAWLRHMLNGEHLYKDIYSAYGPLLVYPAYLMAKIFGPSVFLLRIVYAVTFAFIAIVVIRYILSFLKVNRFFSFFTILFLAIVPGIGMRQGIGLLTILLIFLASKKRNYIWPVFSGISLAASFLISSEIGIFTTVTILVYWIYCFITVKDVRGTLKKILTAVFSAGIFLLLFYFWSSTEGWFSAYIQNVFTDLSIYSSIDLPNGKAFPNIIELFPQDSSFVSWMKFLVSKDALLYWTYLFYICVFTYIFVKISLRKVREEDVLMGMVAVYGFLISMILIGRSGHFPFVLAPVAVICAYFLNQLFDLLKKTKNIKERCSALILIAIIILFTVRIVLIYRPHFHRLFLVPQNISLSASDVPFIGATSISESQKTELLKTTKYIDENTLPTDNVFFLGNEPLMYLVTNRGNPTRYDIPVVANTKEKRLEVLNDIINDKTKVVIFNRNSWSVDGISNLDRLPELLEYLNENYTKSTIGELEVYKIKS